MKTNPFLKAMKIVEGTVSILDSNCVVYSRIWCVYELYKSLMGQKDTHRNAQDALKTKLSFFFLIFK
jgi:hypothetical protein